MKDLLHTFYRYSAILMCWWIKIVGSLLKVKVPSDYLQPPGQYSPWNSPGQNTGVGSLSLLQVIFPTQDGTRVSCIAGGFFTNWAIRKALYVSKPERGREEGKKRKRKQKNWSYYPNTFFLFSVYFLLFSCSVVSDSFWPQGLQHTRLPCPPPYPGCCSNSCPLSRWCHLFTTPLQLRNWFWTCFMFTKKTKNKKQ